MTVVFSLKIFYDLHDDRREKDYVCPKCIDVTRSTARRLTDVSEEPLQNLALIGGYANMPLVSLEEFVEPLVPLVPQVQSYAYIAKEQSQSPMDGLTRDQSAAIMVYMMGWDTYEESIYYALNNILRNPSNRQEKLKPWYLYLRLLLDALFRLPTHSLTAYRGVKLEMTHGYEPGKTLAWCGFSSCATGVTVLESPAF